MNETLNFCGFNSSWPFSNLGQPPTYSKIPKFVSFIFGLYAFLIALVGSVWNSTLLIVIAKSTHQQIVKKQVKNSKAVLINKLTITIVVADLLFSIILFATSKHLLLSNGYHFEKFTHAGHRDHHGYDGHSYINPNNTFLDGCIGGTIHAFLYYSIQFTSILSITSIAFVRWLSSNNLLRMIKTFILRLKFRFCNCFIRVKHKLRIESEARASWSDSNIYHRKGRSGSRARTPSYDPDEPGGGTGPQVGPTRLSIPITQTIQARTSVTRHLTTSKLKVKSIHTDLLENNTFLRFFEFIIITINWVIPIILLAPLTSDEGFDLENDPKVKVRGFVWLPTELFCGFSMSKPMHVQYSISVRTIFQLVPCILVAFFYASFSVITLTMLKKSANKLQANYQSGVGTASNVGTGPVAQVIGASGCQGANFLTPPGMEPAPVTGAPNSRRRSIISIIDEISEGTNSNSIKIRMSMPVKKSPRDPKFDPSQPSQKSKRADSAVSYKDFRLKVLKDSNSYDNLQDLPTYRTSQLYKQARRRSSLHMPNPTQEISRMRERYLMTQTSIIKSESSIILGENSSKKLKKTISMRKKTKTTEIQNVQIDYRRNSCASEYEPLRPRTETLHEDEILQHNVQHVSGSSHKNTSIPQEREEPTDLETNLFGGYGFDANLREVSKQFYREVGPSLIESLKGQSFLEKSSRNISKVSIMSGFNQIGSNSVMNSGNVSPRISPRGGNGPRDRNGSEQSGTHGTGIPGLGGLSSFLALGTNHNLSKAFQKNRERRKSAPGSALLRRHHSLRGRKMNIKDLNTLNRTDSFSLRQNSWQNAKTTVNSCPLGERVELPIEELREVCENSTVTATPGGSNGGSTSTRVPSGQIMKCPEPSPVKVLGGKKPSFLFPSLTYWFIFWAC